MTIPEGFRLGPTEDTWQAIPAGDETWFCTARVGGAACKVPAIYRHRGTGACAAHAISMGALVADAPVVEAPLDPRTASERKSLAREFLANCTSEDAACELVRLQSALAAAEQRADRAEDKLRRIRQVAGNGRHLLDRMVTVQDILWEGTDT